MYLVYSLLVGAWYSTREVFFFYPQEVFFYFIFLWAKAPDKTYCMLWVVGYLTQVPTPLCGFSLSLSKKIKKKKGWRNQESTFSLAQFYRNPLQFPSFTGTNLSSHFFISLYTSQITTFKIFFWIFLENNQSLK